MNTYAADLILERARARRAGRGLLVVVAKLDGARFNYYAKNEADRDDFITRAKALGHTIIN